MTFVVTNIRVETDRLVAFYKFDNGESNSNPFPLTANIPDIMAWGVARGEFFDKREQDLVALREAAMEQEIAVVEGA